MSTNEQQSNRSEIHTTLTKTHLGEWLLNYSTNETLDKIHFLRNPDNSRVQRWHAVTDGFEIGSNDQGEFINRTDGKPFKSVTIKLTPTYVHLAKDYAPFSPFSDGGMLFYSGRFFACAQPCENVSEWTFELHAPEAEKIIVDGQIHQEKVKWNEQGEGQAIYVGSQTAVQNQSFIALIDQGIPDALQQALNQEIPRMMDFFAQKFGRQAATKPILYASYANVQGGSRQGGTLPGQIFMHWNINNLDEQVMKESYIHETLWFFAHEVAHFFQRSIHHEVFGKDHESWIHEGHAELLAGLALQELFPDAEAFVLAKFERHYQSCVDGLTTTTLQDAAQSGRFQLYYSCGSVIHDVINSSNPVVSRDADNTYDVWNDYIKQIESGNPAGMSTFLAVIEADFSIGLKDKITDWVINKLDDPQSSLPSPGVKNNEY